ncbi:4-hydroxyphenylpyruvate dioxygenase [Streptomyces sp. WI04-05B]|uniref:4-hydroxyphenylpyruvate dioxygenase n=1 Tax=Streptomyces TaxID=1883 RepID=UPI0029A120A2|nr:MULTISPECIES: 4-hydroxyphenylpyruvate dioxygenase [unclassified Streptomyces]MDX2547635.1 4-hydroxyphenylpyruvate dioxygenase [Streptomyces sp. WI04-05B]MDX2590109.1 4-hydroxyphenylpyruvate dioxygenase [Streptomyces sp. WI04-05A]MDX3752845.1 4-hydroxyphenylpyruvate dioxygenase [Streptomyces sp. AK08-02]
MSKEILLSHLELYVGDAAAGAAGFVEKYGFEVVETSGLPDEGDDHYSVALRQGGVRLLLTEPRSEEHPAHAYLAAHGEGVVDIALRVPDVAAAFDDAVARGARSLMPPAPVGGSHGIVTAVIDGCGSVRHTLVQESPQSDDTAWLHGFATAESASGGLTGEEVGLLAVDHFALCLGAGELDPAVAYYESVLGFETVFEERVVVGAQAMLSRVVQSASRAVTLTLLEPDTSAAPGQIDDFVENHGGSGVQHVAFSTDDVVRTVSVLRERGVEFLEVPDAYYGMLAEHLTLAAHTTAELRRLQILADQDHDGQLFQIFTRSTHERRTFFLEIIERLGARTFGSGNIKALYEAVEVERTQPRVLS